MLRQICSLPCRYGYVHRRNCRGHKCRPAASRTSAASAAIVVVVIAIPVMAVIVVIVATAGIAHAGMRQSLIVVGFARLVLIARDMVVLANRLLGIDVAAAMEIGGVIGAAGAVIDRGLRPAAQRTRA